MAPRVDVCAVRDQQLQDGALASLFDRHMKRRAVIGKHFVGVRSMIEEKTDALRSWPVEGVIQGVGSLRIGAAGEQQLQTSRVRMLHRVVQRLEVVDRRAAIEKQLRHGREIGHSAGSVQRAERASLGLGSERRIRVRAMIEQQAGDGQ